MTRAMNCWDVFRNSPSLIIFIVFCSLLTDSLLLTLVDPILPDILLNIDTQGVNVSSNVSEVGMVSDTINANGRYGYLVAAKGAAQFLVNPLVGIVVTRFGYRKPMLFGSVLLMSSTVAFAFGNSYLMLTITRVLQGISSSFTAVTGMGLLANTFSDDIQRGKAMGIGIAGLSVGITVGPVYGSVLYQFFGQAMPFLIVAAMVGFATVAMVISYKKEELTDAKDHSTKSILKLIIDPYILIVAVNLFLLNLDVAVILGFLPMRLIDLQHPPTWQLGIVVLPTSIGYFIAGLIFSRTSRWIPRWLCAMFGLLISTATLVMLAFCYTFIQMLAVSSFLGIAVGMVSTSVQPIFAYLVDIRHSKGYGNVYAISDMSVCLAMTIGPLIGGPVYYAIGFEWLVFSCSIMNIIFTPLCILLRNPPKTNQDTSTDEKSPLLASSNSSGYQSKPILSKEQSMDFDDVAYRTYYEILSSTELHSNKVKHQHEKLYETI